MFQKPQLSNFSSYQQYALAAMGYALVGGNCTEEFVSDVVVDSVNDSCSRGRWYVAGLQSLEKGCWTGGTWPRDQGYGQRDVGGSDRVHDVSNCGVGDVVVDCVVNQENKDGAKDNGVSTDCLDKVVGVPGAFGRNRAETVTVVHGPNHERNKKNREQQKRRKAKKRAVASDNWRRQSAVVNEVKKENNKFVPAVDGVHSPVTDSGSKGFWNSCSDDVRRQLIDSKARMHIADNNKRAEEAEHRVRQLQSPEQLLRDAMRMVNFANEQAKKQNDSKVCGWAKTVAESYAETIAKSAPTSVESFESFVQSSSITSVSLEAFEEVVKEKNRLLAENDKLKEDIAKPNVGAKKMQRVVASKAAMPHVKSVAAATPASPKANVCSQEHFLAVQAERKLHGSSYYDIHCEREIVEYERKKW